RKDARAPSSTPDQARPRVFSFAGLVIAAALGLGAAPAAAETRLCNRTSLVTEAAIGVMANDTAATRGWF
ncbi:DUF1036 domain-containing protein, partial [Serratia marcescens]|uniref:DUF1036 domain-containing protein n=1 Tax=Serratia marcescens TaxID=615 RepID=UPI0013DADDD3